MCTVLSTDWETPWFKTRIWGGGGVFVFFNLSDSQFPHGTETRGKDPCIMDSPIDIDLFTSPYVRDPTSPV